MNKYQPHVYVIPEDDRDRQIADGFVGHHAVRDPRIKVVAPAGGWPNVLRTFSEEYVPLLHKFDQAHVVLLIDFDDQVADRLDHFRKQIPVDVEQRVFVVGSKLTPERLKAAMNRSYETIGELLASDCAAGTVEYWSHDQLQHNDAERQRLFQTVRPLVF